MKINALAYAITVLIIIIYYNLMASIMVSGNFFRNVSGLNSTEIATKIAAPPNRKAGTL